MSRAEHIWIHTVVYVCNKHVSRQCVDPVVVLVHLPGRCATIDACMRKSRSLRLSPDITDQGKKRALYSMATASLLTLFAAASAWPSTTVKHTGCQPPLDDPSSNAYPRVDFARNRSRVIVGPALLLGPESRVVACGMGLELRLVRVHNLAATVLALQVLAIAQSAIAQGC